jgi:chorismate synthase
MSGNFFGRLFRVATFGESHGPALGCVLDGVPAGLPLNVEAVMQELARRRPGQSAVATSRQEQDQCEILSGVFEGVTTGTPIALLVRNTNQRSGDYTALAEQFRPGHADYTYFRKYGRRDWRGGGRSSGRETVARVAAGAVAKLLLRTAGVTVRAGSAEIAGIAAETFDWDEAEKNPARCPDASKAAAMVEAITAAAARGDSVGGIVVCEVSGLPVGLGEPVIDKLDAELAKAVMSLGSVKGIEFGSGFAAARMTGSEHNDAMLAGGRFSSNHAGGVLGGISTGAALCFRVAVKPTASVSLPQQTVDTQGNQVTISVQGRHDPCIVPRIVPVIEAMAALVLADAWLQHRAGASL